MKSLTDDAMLPRRNEATRGEFTALTDGIADSTKENVMAGSGVQLIPSSEEILQILKRTGAFREGHFVHPTGRHSKHYFQMPLAFRYYDTARVLAVALSRKFRIDRDIASQLPKISV